MIVPRVGIVGQDRRPVACTSIISRVQVAPSSPSERRRRKTIRSKMAEAARRCVSRATIFSGVRSTVNIRIVRAGCARPGNDRGHAAARAPSPEIHGDLDANHIADLEVVRDGRHRPFRPAPKPRSRPWPCRAAGRHASVAGGRRRSVSAPSTTYVERQDRTADREIVRRRSRRRRGKDAVGDQLGEPLFARRS